LTTEATDVYAREGQKTFGKVRQST
jgi:hypothetical protein